MNEYEITGRKKTRSQKIIVTAHHMRLAHTTSEYIAYFIEGDEQTGLASAVYAITI